ncbi:MAG: hypothetical protein IPJ41_11510 [Phycisphaerales bacterium]|nr:hypothetical protein [Phycisphaerales bacterium]
MPGLITCTAALVLALASPNQTDRPDPHQPETLPSQPTDWQGDAYRALQALDASDKPQSASTPAALPGLDLTQLAAIPADAPQRADADLPLQDALARCRIDRPAPSPAPKPSSGVVVRAQRLYASGLSRMLDNDFPGAARDLTNAARLDPSAIAPWLRLAEVQDAMGQPGAAMLAYRKAADLGADDPVALGELGLQAARSGQQADAADFLSRCLAASPETADPLLRNVVMGAIAAPLRQAGYIRASIEALRQAFDLPSRLVAPTSFGDEANDLVRRSSDLWRDMGDAACRLGEDGLAAECYSRAAQLPSLDPSAILARRAYVLMRSGRAAAAALLVLDDIAARNGRADARHIGLLAGLRADPTIAPLAIRALNELAASLPRPPAPTTASAIARAQAAAAPDEQARQILLAQLADRPRDREVLATLMGRLPSDAERVTTALQAVDQSPDAGAEIASVLAGWHADPASLLQSLPQSPAGRLLRDWIRIGWSRQAEVVATESPSLLAPGAEPVSEAEFGVVGVAAALAGRWDIADQILERLPQSGLARAEVLRAAQRYPEALRSLEPLLGPDASIAAMLRGSELALGAAQVDRSEELLRRVLAIDPYEESAYEGLLAVNQGRGDERGAGEVARQLRARVPSSHLLRWINAQELAQRGQLGDAEQTLHDLVEDAPENANAFGLLTQIWQQRARSGATDAIDAALSWIDHLQSARPASPDATAARARLLAMRGQADEAIKLLESEAARRPAPAISRALEEVLRASGQQDRADALALARLDAAGHGIDSSLERAELDGRQGRLRDAVADLHAAMPDRSILTAPQKAQLLAVLSAAATRASEANDAIDPLLALIDEVGAHEIELPWQILFSKWTLLSRRQATGDDQVALAAQAFVDAIPSLEVAKSLMRPAPNQRHTPTDTLEEAKAEIAYEVANSLYNDGRENASLVLFAQALRLNPDHTWAANDLGYFLLERGERLDEAARLLERAYAAAPGEANIADSLGWLRYKRGQLTDETTPDGAKREGAVTILTTATTLADGSTNPTIYDHLGDALWRAGDTDRAQAMWLRAQQLLVQRLTQIRGAGNEALRQQLTDSAGSTGAKLDAVRAGKEPPIAPQGED